MEDKIEVNEYIRTDRGEIAKVTSVAKETLGEILGANEYRSIGFCNTDPYVYGNIVKHSKQLIDLIEVGDFVNGYKVISVDYDVMDDTIECTELDLNSNYQYNFISIRQIKTILTRESYMANCYKVGGRE